MKYLYYDAESIRWRCILNGFKMSVATSKLIAEVAE
jgi:hypothetical protein